MKLDLLSKFCTPPGILTNHGRRQISEVKSEPAYLNDFELKAAAALPLPWTKTTTTTVGAPTGDYVSSVRNGVYQLKLASNSEAESARVDFADTRPIPLEAGLVCEFWIDAINALPIAAERMAFGLVSAYNATWDSATINCWFRLEANGDLLVETDDNTTDNDDKATSKTLVIATRYGLRIVVDTLSRIEFQFSTTAAASDAKWTTTNVLSMKDLTAANRLVQIIMAVQKDSGTGVPDVQADFAGAWGWKR